MKSFVTLMPPHLPATLLFLLLIPGACGTPSRPFAGPGGQGQEPDEPARRERFSNQCEEAIESTEEIACNPSETQACRQHHPLWETECHCEPAPHRGVQGLWSCKKEERTFADGDVPGEVMEPFVPYGWIPSGVTSLMAVWGSEGPWRWLEVVMHRPSPSDPDRQILFAEARHCPGEAPRGSFVVTAPDESKVDSVRLVSIPDRKACHVETVQGVVLKPFTSAPHARLPSCGVTPGVARIIGHNSTPSFPAADLSALMLLEEALAADKLLALIRWDMVNDWKNRNDIRREAPYSLVTPLFDCEGHTEYASMYGRREVRLLSQVVMTRDACLFDGKSPVLRSNLAARIAGGEAPFLRTVIFLPRDLDACPEGPIAEKLPWPKAHAPTMRVSTMKLEPCVPEGNTSHTWEGQWTPLKVVRGADQIGTAAAAHPQAEALIREATLMGDQIAVLPRAHRINPKKGDVTSPLSRILPMSQQEAQRHSMQEGWMSPCMDRQGKARVTWPAMRVERRYLAPGKCEITRTVLRHSVGFRVPQDVKVLGQAREIVAGTCDPPEREFKKPDPNVPR